MLEPSPKALGGTGVQRGLEPRRLSFPSNGVAREQPSLPGVWMNFLAPGPQRVSQAHHGLLFSTGLINRGHCPSV